MIMKNSYKIIIFVAILAVAVFLEHSLVNLLKTASLPTSEKLEEANQEIAVALRIDFDNGNISNYNGVKLGEEKTVFNLLKKVAEENNLEFSFKEYPDLGVLVESIGSVKNDFGINKWWQYWVNEQYATVGADKHELKNNDLVEWKYIKGQF